MPVHPHVNLTGRGPDDSPRREFHSHGVVAHRDALLDVLHAERSAFHKEAQRLRSAKNHLMKDVADLETACEYWTTQWAQCQERLDRLELELLVLRQALTSKIGPHNVKISDVSRI
jgi:predicted  nucleic acid-binding Zn-ribbon protein